MKRASFSLEAMLVFVGVMLFWVVVFTSIAPQLKEMQEQVVKEELMGECLKVTNTVDTIATYGAETIYLSLTPYFEQSMERGIFFCQEHDGCGCGEDGRPPEHGCSKTIFAVKVNRTGGMGEGMAKVRNILLRVNCSAHVADWVDIVVDGGDIYKCGKIGGAEGREPGGNFTIQFGSYYEKPKMVGGGEKTVRDCWE